VTNATREELIQWRVDEAVEAAKQSAAQSIEKAIKNPTRSTEALNTIYLIHGQEKQNAAAREITKSLCHCGSVSIAQCDNCDGYFCDEHVGQRGGDRQV
jgi:predicted nucleic acid binding AN1-type Zn finger protein